MYDPFEKVYKCEISLKVSCRLTFVGITMNRHKTIHCNICMKTMRSDNLKKHHQVHAKHNAVNEKNVTSSYEESSSI